MSDPDCHESYYFCKHCKGKLPHEEKHIWLKDAEWVAEGRDHGHRSFHINQMYAPNLSPGELVQEYHRSILSDLAAVEFKNQVLGVPHLMAGAQLSDAIIDPCKRGYQMGTNRPDDASETICMGIDVGNFIDVVVTQFNYDGDPGRHPYEHSTAKILHTVRIPTFEDGSWEQLNNMMGEWQVRYAVIDSLPEASLSRRFCRKWMNHSAMCQFRKGTTGKEIKEALDEHRVPTLTVDWTAFMDMALRRYHNGRIIVPGNLPAVVSEHLMSPARIFEDDEYGLPKPVYVSDGDDHFAYASLYAEVAHLRAYKQSTGRTIEPGEDL